MADLDQQLHDLDGEHNQLAAHILKAAEEAAALPSGTGARNAARAVAGAADQVTTFERLRPEALAARRGGRTGGERVLDAVRGRDRTLEAPCTSRRSRHPGRRRRVPGLGHPDRARSCIRLRRRDEPSRLLRSVGNDDAEEWAAQRIRAGEDDAAARTLAAELEALDATKGAEYREVVARTAELGAAIAQEAAQSTAHKAFRAVETKVIQLQERSLNAEREREQAVQHRDRTQEHFVWSTGTLLADDAGLSRRGEPDGDRVRPTLDLARQVLRDLGNTYANMTPLVVAGL